MPQMDARESRIAKILGDVEELTFDERISKFHEHLANSLELPCDVTGMEDFSWEEYYIFGPGHPQEYERLRENQPSFADVYELLELDADVFSEWMMFYEDLAFRVRRKSDGKEFYLGLAELQAVDEDSKNYQLINDYSSWLVNNR